MVIKRFFVKSCDSFGYSTLCYLDADRMIELWKCVTIVCKLQAFVGNRFNIVLY